jgi:hypothetical protein
VTGLLQAADGGAIARLAGLPDPGGRVREAFQMVYGRAPDAAELAACQALFRDPAARPADTTRDLLCALLTSAEFLAMP